MASVCFVCLMTVVFVAVAANTTEGPDGHICVFRGTGLSEGETVRLDACTLCTCRDYVTTCSTESCPPVSCLVTELEPVEGKCCLKCPYKMLVQDTHILYDDLFHFSDGDERPITFGLDVTVRRQKPSSRSIQGQDMWKLAAWISHNADGGGKRFSEIDNVLNEDEADRTYFRKKYQPSWTWENLSYLMTFTGGSCADYKYFCVKFNKGDNPLPKFGLKFYFQIADDDENILIDCTPLGNCSESPT